MAATIKITALPSIGSNLTNNALLPIVSTNGAAQTDKITVGNLANFVLSQSGNTLSPALLATFSQSVVNAAQPNITSVGTLTSLDVTGNITGDILTINTSAVSNGYVSNSTIGTYDLDVSNKVDSYADNATVTFSNFSGMIMINNHDTGGVAMWLVGGNAAILQGTATGTGTGMIGFDSGNYVWTNDSGSTASFSFAAIRTRAAS